MTIHEPFREAAEPGGAHPLLLRAEEFATQFRKTAAERDLERRLPKEEIAALAAGGVLTGRIPRCHGGPELDMTETVRIFLALAAADPNIAQAILPHYCVIEELRLYGSEEQQRRYFELMLRGHVFANAHAERGGKLIGDLSTELRADGEGFRVSGTKYYSTGSLFADHLFVSAVGHDGEKVMLILPTDRPGIELVDDWEGMGQRTTASGTVILKDVAVGREEVIADRGWRKTRTHFGPFAQILHAAIDAGIARGVLPDAVAYARDGARPLPEAGVVHAVDDPYVAHTVGEIAVLAHSAEAMVERAAVITERAARAFFAGSADEAVLGAASLAVAEAKAVATENSLRASEFLFRIGGASATTRKRNFDRHWRNARTHTVHDPVAYKYRAIGIYHLKGTLPPPSGKF
ncbi:dehydrogenase [Bosea caraganae]|uniref:Dehydrogenase n=1 Tax=Bosea caraganae TaxID=2763117 RepID=A0A370L2L1_9HYPH|nr:acyl-CoA dehydrogenase family protein [Bosea caraganae]RDJ22429.1 dehydrogenase [Bosea caraganae]RDJ30388.1 dehydrogenase [Bosea caraganae]